MRRITISGNLGTITLLPDLEFTIKPEPVESSVEMASGKTVIDTRGMRTTLNIPTGWLSGTDLALLKNMISAERILRVSYPDVEGDKTIKMVFEQPEYKSFKYSDDGVELWYGVTLRAKSQEITPYEEPPEPPTPPEPEDWFERACGIMNRTLFGTPDAEE